MIDPNHVVLPHERSSRNPTPNVSPFVPLARGLVRRRHHPCRRPEQRNPGLLQIDATRKKWPTQSRRCAPSTGRLLLPRPTTPQLRIVALQPLDQARYLGFHVECCCCCSGAPACLQQAAFTTTFSAFTPPRPAASRRVFPPRTPPWPSAK